MAALKGSKAVFKDDGDMVEIKEERIRLVKYEGDPPKPGEDKQPFEIVEWRAGHQARVTHKMPGQPPESYADLPYDPQPMEK